MAYEVIKRVSGRAYRYRVESFRDPETRRVRGRWTYLGRVDPADAGLPDRPVRPSSRERLLDAVARLLAEHDAESLSAGSIAREAAVAYGTFYRYFTDRAHAVREALLRGGPTLGSITTRFEGTIGGADAERARIATWLRDALREAEHERGVIRAWHVYSNQDETVQRARRERIDACVDAMTRYLERLQTTGVARIASPSFAAYALVALAVAVAREAALEGPVGEEKIGGLIALANDLCGLT